MGTAANADGKWQKRWNQRSGTVVKGRFLYLGSWPCLNAKVFFREPCVAHVSHECQVQGDARVFSLADGCAGCCQGERGFFHPGMAPEKG